ncbi:MAG: hypothetical protein AAFN70_08260, partial [Planctomycetota bacterium]
MNQREKILAILVAVVVLAFVGQYAWSQYSEALKYRTNQITNLDRQLKEAEIKRELGLLATVKWDDFRVRSLPSEKQAARVTYTAWLIEWAGKRRFNVDFSNSIPAPGGLYTQYAFTVNGESKMETVVEMLHDFQQTDYLHRIAQLSLNRAAQVDARGRSRGGNEQRMRVTMTIHALALTDAVPETLPQPQSSPLIAADVDAYRLPIMNRNFFHPPNKGPKVEGLTRVEAIMGKDYTYAPQLSDPDGDTVRLELVGDVPEGVRVDKSSNKIRVRRDSESEVNIAYRVTDDGWPAISQERQVLVRFVPPPPAPTPPTAPKGFDHATQTKITGLLYGNKGWTAILRILTQGKS